MQTILCCALPLLLAGVTRPVSFDTPEADKALESLQVFPPDNPWNQDVSAWPVARNSRNIIASIGASKPLRHNTDMGFILVPPDQRRVAVKITGYPDESDGGPFPVPDNVPIEGWPAGYAGKRVTLADVQRDKLREGGDRHAIVVDPASRMLYEFYQLRRTDGGWQAAQASVFDLKSNKLRPEGWTSTDAAGLPIFPAVVRYDELRRGMVGHAMRVTVQKSRRAYVHPATHFASRSSDPNLPRMGERIRLKRDFPIDGFSPNVQAVLKGLKKYGMFVADNGLDWAISVAPDPRIPVMHEELRRIKGSAFEVVEAPRSDMPSPEQTNAEVSPPVMSVRRRFGIGTLLIATGACAVLLGWLRWMDAGPWTMSAAFLALVGIALAQAFLGGGRLPRGASAGTGAVLFPLVMAALRYESSAHQQYAGISDVFGWALFGVPFGAIVGYLVGAVLAGVFCILETRPKTLESEAGLQGRPDAKGRRWWLVPLTAMMVVAWLVAGRTMYRYHVDFAADVARREAESLADSPIFQRVERAAGQIERLGGRVPDRDVGSYARYRSVVLTGWHGKEADLALLRDFVGLVNVRQLHYRGMQIDASGTALSDDAVPYLVELADVLVRLDIRNTRITGNGVQELQKGLPDCKVIY